MVLGWSTAGTPLLPASTIGRDRSPDSEKITINLGPVDLGQIDLLVAEGFYSNRTDLIRTAIRNQLAVHADPIRRPSTARRRWDVYSPLA